MFKVFSAACKLAEYVGKEHGLALLEFAHTLFNSALRNQAVYDDFAFLAYPMDSVYRLIFHGGIPPRVGDENVIGSRKRVRG